MKVILMSNMV